MKRTLKKSKNKKFRNCIIYVFIVLSTGIYLVLLASHFNTPKEEPHSSNTQPDSKKSSSDTGHIQNPDIESIVEENKGVEINKKPNFEYTEDKININFTDSDNKYLRHRCLDLLFFIVFPRQIYFKGFETVSFVRIKVNLDEWKTDDSRTKKDLKDLYILQDSVFNFVIPKINWVKESCTNNSYILNFFLYIYIKSRNHQFYMDFLNFLNSLMDIFCISVIWSSEPWSVNINKLEGLDCFNIYKKDIVDIIEHILGVYRALIGRINTIRIIEILWDNIPSENNVYIRKYRKVMIEAVGSEPLIC